MNKTFREYIGATKIGIIIKNIFALVEFKLVGLYHSKNSMGLMYNIINEDKPFLLMPSELFILHALSKLQTTLTGDYAEVGVFKGATAKAICETKGAKTLHLFDTFEGLPEVDKHLDPMFKKNLFKSNFEKVKLKLQKYENVFLYKGFFPQTGESIKDKTFAFVHLDVDTYQSTKDCLGFFYQRMNLGGIIISHDYHAKGVRKAFDEFFQERQVPVAQLPMSQCMVIKRD